MGGWVHDIRYNIIPVVVAIRAGDEGVKEEEDVGLFDISLSAEPIGAHDIIQNYYYYYYYSTRRYVIKYLYTYCCTLCSSAR